MGELIREFPFQHQVIDHRVRYLKPQRHRTDRNTNKSYFRKNCKFEISGGRTHLGILIPILGETSSSEMSETTKTSDRPNHVQKLFLKKRDFLTLGAFLRGGELIGRFHRGPEKICRPNRFRWPKNPNRRISRRWGVTGANVCDRQTNGQTS